MEFLLTQWLLKQQKENEPEPNTPIPVVSFWLGY